ncbi:hypothetical protein Tco_1363184 [Tanacetum coccineum]
MVSPLNDNEIEFRISFDESDDEDYMVNYDENSFFYKIISVNNLKTDSENDNDKVNMPLFPTPEPKVSYSNDLDLFKDFENEFPAIVYNDALTSKSDFLTEHIASPQHIAEFNNDTSLSEPSELNENIGGVFINLEILKCWSLEISRWLFNTFFAQELNLENHPEKNIKGKKAHAKADRSKGIEILSDAALSKAAQLKEAIKRSKKDYHISQASGSGDGSDFESGVPHEQQRKTSGTDEGTDNSEDDNDDDSDDDSKGDDDKADSDDDDYDEEEHDEEYESNDDNENVFEEEDDDLYKDVDVRSLGAEQEQERKGEKEITDADQNVSQENSYEQVIEDTHVTLTSSQKTDSSKQSSSVSSNFASKFLILENVPPAVDEVTSMMNIKSHREESST